MRFSSPKKKAWSRLSPIKCWPVILCFLILFDVKTWAKANASNSSLCTRKEIAKLQQAGKTAFWDKAEPILQDCHTGVKPYGDSLLPLILMGTRNLPSPTFEGGYYLSKWFLPAYQQGNAETRKLLLKNLRGRAHHDESGWVLPVLGAIIDEQIEGMKKANATALRMDIPISDQKPWNAELTQSSPLYPHWQNVQGLREVYRKRIPEVTPQGDISYQKMDSAFWIAVVDYMQEGPSQRNLEAVHAFQWSGWCGTGSQYFQAARTWIDFSHFLAMGDMPAALGAILEGQDDELSQNGRMRRVSETEESPSSASRLKRFLDAVNLPWRPFFLGLAAERKEQALEFLAREGGDSALPGILLLDAFFADRRSSYIQALGAYIPSQCRDKASRLVNRPISLANQNRVLEKLNQMAAEIETGNLANAFAEVMAEICHPALLRSAIELATLPYPGPREKLARYFSQYGVKQVFPDISKQVAIILTYQGMPLLNQRVNWELPADCKDMDYCGGMSSWAETDSLGRILMNRDHLRPGGRAVFCIADTLHPELPGFYHQEITLPSRIPEILNVPVHTGSLSVHFSGESAFDRAKIKLNVSPVISWPLKHDPSSYNKGKFYDFVWRNEKSGASHFASFPTGRYDVCAYAFGWSLACADSIEIRPDQKTEVELIPRRGSDIVFRFVDSATGIERKFVSWSVVKSENPQRSRYFSSQPSPPRELGLSPGKYVLHIRQQRPKLTESMDPFLKQVPFTVKVNSPSLIDLGDILIVGKDEY